MKLYLFSLFVASASAFVPVSQPSRSRVLQAVDTETDYDAPVERQIAAGNVVRTPDSDFTLGFGDLGTVGVPKFLQAAFGLKNKGSGWTLDDEHILNIDDECYVGKEGSPDDDCVDYDPMHTPDGKLMP